MQSRPAFLEPLTVPGVDWLEARVQPWLIDGKVQHVEVQHPKGVVRVVAGECLGELDNSALRASHSRNKGGTPLAADDAVTCAFQYLQGNFLSFTGLSTLSAEARHPRGADAELAGFCSMPERTQCWQ